MDCEKGSCADNREPHQNNLSALLTTLVQSYSSLFSIWLEESIKHFKEKGEGAFGVERKYFPLSSSFQSPCNHTFPPHGLSTIPLKINCCVAKSCTYHFLRDLAFFISVPSSPSMSNTAPAACRSKLVRRANLVVCNEYPSLNTHFYTDSIQGLE